MSDLTRLRQLVEIWRHSELVAGQASVDVYGDVAAAAEARTFKQCADELESALAATTPPLTEVGSGMFVADKSTSVFHKAAITPPAQPEDDELTQVREVLAWDMTHEDGPLPEPLRPLGPTALACYGAIQELRQRRTEAASE